MRRILILGMVTACFCAMLAGCASTGSHDDVLARLMQEIEREKQFGTSGTDGGDAPEKPVSGLPPIPGETVATDDGPVANSSDLTIQPDCLVQISVKEDPSLDGSYPVNDIGAVELNYVGPVILYNKTERGAEAKIRQVLMARDFRTATVSVRIVRASYDKVQVSGAVNKPGLIRIGAGDRISLNDALLRAGGLRPSAQGAKVRIVRDGLLSAVALSLQGEEHSLVTDEGLPIVPDVSLDNNDVAFVFASQMQAPSVVGEKEVTVLGEVKKTGVYRFSGTEACTMMHLMFKMGGLPPYANQKAVEIHRRDENGIESIQKINVEDILENGNPAQDVSLENGDRIVVRRRKIHIF